MESNRDFDVRDLSKVVSLDDQRKVRRQREAELATAEAHVDSVAEYVCEGDVCTLAWKPTKKAA